MAQVRHASPINVQSNTAANIYLGRWWADCGEGGREVAQQPTVVLATTTIDRNTTTTRPIARTTKMQQQQLYTMIVTTTTTATTTITPTSASNLLFHSNHQNHCKILLWEVAFGVVNNLELSELQPSVAQCSSQIPPLRYF